MLARWRAWRMQVDGQLANLDKMLHAHRVQVQKDHDCLESHARATQQAVQELRENGARRGEQLDMLLRLQKGLRIIGTALLTAFLLWFGAQIWFGIVRQSALSLAPQPPPQQEKRP